MKYLRILVDPIKIKGDPEDPEQLQVDFYEKLLAMIESETLSFTIDEDYTDDDDEF